MYFYLLNWIWPFIYRKINISRFVIIAKNNEGAINTIKVAISRSFDEALIKHTPKSSIYIDLSVVNTPKDLIPELLIQLG